MKMLRGQSNPQGFCRVRDEQGFFVDGAHGKLGASAMPPLPIVLVDFPLMKQNMQIELCSHLQFCFIKKCVFNGKRTWEKELYAFFQLSRCFINGSS